MKKEFFMVPNSIFEWGLSTSEMVVLIYLLRCADSNTRLCYPSYDKIRKSCKITRSTAIKAIDKLCEHNIIAKVSKGYFEDHINKANTYKINDIFKPLV